MAWNQSGSPRSMGYGSRAFAGALFLTILWESQVYAQRQDPAATQQIQAYFEDGEQALARKNYQLAVEAFQRMLELNPNLAGAHANLGIAYYLQGHYDEASHSFQQAIEIRPSLTNAELYLGLSEARAGRLEEALPPLSKGFWNATNDEWRLQAGLLLVEAQYARLEYDKALEVVRALQEAFPNDADVLYIAYRLHSNLGAKAIAKLVRVAPHSARLHQVTAELLESEGDYPRAVRQYRRALEADPRLAGANRALGVAIISSDPDEDAFREAEESFQRELALNPRDAESLYQLGEIHWRRNEPDEALAHFSKAVDVHPNFVEALIALGKVWMAKEELEKAADYLKRAVEIQPDNDVAHYRLGQAYRQMGRIEDATKALEKFREIRSAMESLGAIYRQVQRSTVTGQTVQTQGAPR